MAQLHELIDALAFGTLVSNGPAGPRVSHLPFLLERAGGTRGTLRGHLARANPHWHDLDGQPVLALFHGPHHYVSPAWYPSKQATGKVVPTWNYLVVQARGRVRVRQDAGWLRALVEALTDRHETPRSEPWRVDDAPADFVETMLTQIVGLEVCIEHLEGKLKLGQNRPAPDRAGLAAGLEQERPAVWQALNALRAPAADG